TVLKLKLKGDFDFWISSSGSTGSTGFWGLLSGLLGLVISAPSVDLPSPSGSPSSSPLLEPSPSESLAANTLFQKVALLPRPTTDLTENPKEFSDPPYEELWQLRQPNLLPFGICPTRQERAFDSVIEKKYTNTNKIILKLTVSLRFRWFILI
ncbi:hypothetical protein OAE67_00320, partial [bacterium]|nr:hypothetical protein [bacterium]